MKSVSGHFKVETVELPDQIIVSSSPSPEPTRDVTASGENYIVLTSAIFD